MEHLTIIGCAMKLNALACLIQLLLYQNQTQCLKFKNANDFVSWKKNKAFT